VTFQPADRADIDQPAPGNTNPAVEGSAPAT
jgi:hypothetical protein